MTPPASFPEVGRNHRKRIPTRGIKKITKISWFLGSRTGLARVGGKTRWMGVLVEVDWVGEGFRGWAHQGGDSPRWIRMDLEGTLVVRAGQVAVTTLSLGLEVWVRVTGVEVETGTRVVEVEADVMEGMGEAGAGMEVPGGRTIVTVIAITSGEAMTAGGEEGIIEVVVGVVTVHVGEVAVVAEAVAVAEAVVGGTELSHIHAFRVKPYPFAHPTPGTAAQSNVHNCSYSTRIYNVTRFRRALRATRFLNYASADR